VTDDVRPLPEYVTDAILLAGARVLVLMEGPDDEWAFTEWFQDRLDDIVFVAVSGKADVIAKVAEIERSRPEVGAHGIVDRDYATADEVQSALDDPNSRCFLLRRFSIENYALEPAAVFDVLRVYLRSGMPHSDALAVEAMLLGVCADLHTMMSANYVLREHSDEVPLFPAGYQPRDREHLVRTTAERIDAPGGPTDVEARIASREKETAGALVAIDAAHEVVSGKHIVFRLLEFANGRRGTNNKLSSDYLFSQLVEWCRNHPPPHPDLVVLVDRCCAGCTVGTISPTPI
jgi:hypothetical protein